MLLPSSERLRELREELGPMACQKNSSEVFCRGRAAANSELSGLTMTSLSLLLAVVAEEAGGVGG
jgi:hypothetical protein